MYEHIVLEKYRVDSSGTHLQIKIPDKDISYYITDKKAKYGELRIDDGRHISALQRKKIYATIRDISDWTGYVPEEQKEWLKFLHTEQTGEPYFSLSNCSMDTAKEFINTILEYALKEGVPLSEAGVYRTDDIGRYFPFICKIDTEEEVDNPDAWHKANPSMEYMVGWEELGTEFSTQRVVTKNYTNDLTAEKNST